MIPSPRPLFFPSSFPDYSFLLLDCTALERNIAFSSSRKQNPFLPLEHSLEIDSAYIGLPATLQPLGPRFPFSFCSFSSLHLLLARARSVSRSSLDSLFSVTSDRAYRLSLGPLYRGRFYRSSSSSSNLWPGWSNSTIVKSEHGINFPTVTG